MRLLDSIEFLFEVYNYVIKMKSVGLSGVVFVGMFSYLDVRI